MQREQGMNRNSKTGLLQSRIANVLDGFSECLSKDSTLHETDLRLFKILLPTFANHHAEADKSESDRAVNSEQKITWLGLTSTDRTGKTSDHV
jgi:hypothetical protein